MHAWLSFLLYSFYKKKSHFVLASSVKWSSPARVTGNNSFFFFPLSTTWLPFLWSHHLQKFCPYNLWIRKKKTVSVITSWLYSIHEKYNFSRGNTNDRKNTKDRIIGISHQQRPEYKLAFYSTKYSSCICINICIHICGYIYIHIPSNEVFSATCKDIVRLVQLPLLWAFFLSPINSTSDSMNNMNL